MSDATTTNHQILVVGNDRVGVNVARRLSGDVTFFGLNKSVARRVTGDVSNVETLTDVNTFSTPPPVDTAVVATGRDSANLLAATRLRQASETDILARVNDPDNEQVFTDLGIVTVCTTTELGETLANRYVNQME
jgi:Trk K+ transport system NAD-binding subunit